MSVKLILLIAAIVLFVLLAFKVIDHNLFQWQMGAMSLFAASFLPLPTFGSPSQ